MKAAICTKYGNPEVVIIKDVQKPIVKPDEILVKIYASAINSGDVKVRGLQVPPFLKLIMRFVLGFQKPRKATLGTQYVGIVEEIGNKVTKFKIGDEVFGLRGFDFGGHAEYISVKENSVICHKPINASFEEAAAIVFGGQTAHYFIHKSIVPKTPNAKVLIYGASGAVGTAALQIAKYYKADITAVCSESSNELMNKLGITKVINYDKTDLSSITEKYEFVFDAHGSLKKSAIKHLFSPNAKFMSVSSLDYAKESSDQLLFLKQLFELGMYNACIDKTFSLDQIVEAHSYVDTGKKKGNVVLKIAENRSEF